MPSNPPPSAYPSTNYVQYTSMVDGGQYATIPKDLPLDHSESPLDSLVRKTSMRRNVQGPPSSNKSSRQQVIQDQRTGQQNHQTGLVWSISNDSDEHWRESAYDAYYDPSPPIPQIQATPSPASTSKPSERRLQIHVAPPDASSYNPGLPSPLLHSTFERDSVGTAYSTNNTYARHTSIGDSTDPDFRSSYASSSLSGQPPRSRTRASNQSTTPSQYADDSLSAYRYFGGSRGDDASSIYSQSTVRGLDPALRDSWRSEDPRVLPDSQSGQRQFGPPSPIPTVVVSSPSQHSDGPFDNSSLPPSQSHAPVLKPAAFNYSRPVRTQVTEVPVQEERVTPQLHPDMMEQKKAVLERRGKMAVPSVRAEPSRRSLEQDSLQLNSSNGRAASPVSVYSDYSYYPYGSAAPSPTTPTGLRPSGADPPNDLRKTRSTPALMPKQQGGGMTPEDYLALGIQHHEADRMQESVRCFERSANEGGGCGGGMLMYGLALRHGWGCAKNENLGFRWLRKAAESVVGDLEKVRTGGSGTEIGAMKKELPLAIYEVGHCFFHGWGVPKDQKMGFSYYAAAARLGDGDAQMTLADCLEKGKGCKKDKKEAAKWYREAINQGQSDVGLAWIYKEKYQ